MFGKAYSLPPDARFEDWMATKTNREILPTLAGMVF